MDSGDYKERNYWTKKQTRLLVEAVRTHIGQLQNRSTRKMAVFNAISRDMEAAGSQPVDPDNARKKWYNMVATYKKINDEKWHGERDEARWPFYEIMDELIGEPPNVPRVPVAPTPFIPVKRSRSDSGDSDTPPPPPLPSVPEQQCPTCHSTKPREEPPQWFIQNCRDREEDTKIWQQWDKIKMAELRQMHQEEMAVLNHLVQIASDIRDSVIQHELQ